MIKFKQCVPVNIKQMVFEFSHLVVDSVRNIRVALGGGR